MQFLCSKKALIIHSVNAPLCSEVDQLKHIGKAGKVNLLVIAFLYLT